MLNVHVPTSARPLPRSSSALEQRDVNLIQTIARSPPPHSYVTLIPLHQTLDTGYQTSGLPSNGQ